MKIEISILKYSDLKLDLRDSEKLRGYIGNKYIETDILHNHTQTGYIYRYPLTQYKVIDSVPMIIGIREASEIVKNIEIDCEDINIEGTVFASVNREVTSKFCNYNETDDYISYEFISPWIALNQENIVKYRNSSDMEKETMLKKILIGNIISMSKGLEYTVKKELFCWINLVPVNVNLKNKNLIAFKGEFKVNFDMPNYLGLGKSASRGFGTFKRK